MPDRLSPLDVSFLARETPTTAMHAGSVGVFERSPVGLDYERLIELVRRRIDLVPRYRQKVRTVPGRLANPVWVDDEDFDLTYHVRRAWLPRPGTPAQLRELVAQLMSRRIDRSHPLWETYLVEGLADECVAVVTKTHLAMVDGVSAVDLGTVLLDRTATPGELPADDWTPGRGPGRVALVAGAVAEVAQRPRQAVDAARGAAVDARGTASRAAAVAGGLLWSARAVSRRAPSSPLSARLSERRRVGTARTRLADYTRVRDAHGGTVHDVVLATVTGALRAWLLARGEPVAPGATLRATVPVSVRHDGRPGELGNRVSAYLVDLPVGEGSAVMRLHRVAYAMRGHRQSGHAVGADALVQLSGFAPPTLHSLGARAAAGVPRRAGDLVVTNVPGPQVPLYAAGARLRELYPVPPLRPGQALSVGVTSYDGLVCYGLTADHDALPDVDVLAACLQESLSELVGTVR